MMYDCPCSYCGVRRAVNADHVVPKSLQKKLRQRGVVLPTELKGTVPSCFECNMRKATRKLVPPSWEDRIPALVAAVPGQWRVWRGDVRERAFSAVHR